MLPSLILPSYRLALYSGMPRPTSAPVTPPTAAPIPAPASAAIIGPAAINGPTPGIAREPIPMSHPKAPPKTPPVPAPVAAPSGALVCCSSAKSFVPDLSGNRAEISLLEKPAALRSWTILSAWLSLSAKQKTDFDMTFSLNLVCDLQLVFDTFYTGNLLGFGDDIGFLGLVFHRPTQRYYAFGGDDFDVFAIGREGVICIDRLPDVL